MTFWSVLASRADWFDALNHFLGGLLHVSRWHFCLVSLCFRAEKATQLDNICVHHPLFLPTKLLWILSTILHVLHYYISRILRKLLQVKVASLCLHGLLSMIHHDFSGFGNLLRSGSVQWLLTQIARLSIPLDLGRCNLNSILRSDSLGILSPILLFYKVIFTMQLLM